MGVNFNLGGKRLNPPSGIIVNYPRTIKKIVVSWNKIISNDSSIECIRYNIYRGQSINGLFVKLNTQELSTNIFEDKNINVNPNIRYYYKISTIAYFNDGTRTESKFSEPTSYKIETDNKWFKKINERNMWILKNDAVLMDLYVRKIDGEQCPNCYDEYRGQSSNSNCPICYGTGIVGGYEPCVQLYIRQKPANIQINQENSGFVLNSTPGAWTISSIQIRNRDLLINPEGKMFVITSSQVNHAAGYLFHQEFQMTELDPKDNRYNIERKTLYTEF